MKILYIAGLAHSGSTYLSRVLNQHPEIFSAGELLDIHEEFSKVSTSGIDCACFFHNTERETCPFWSEVHSQLNSTNWDPLVASRLSTDRRIEWMQALYEYLFCVENKSFALHNKKLFQVISDVSNSRVVIDCSKTLWRLIPIHNHLDENVQILHLVKSPSNQVGSRLKRGYNFYHSAFLKYFRKNFLLQRLFGQNSNYLRITFESFIRESEETLDKILNWLDLTNPGDLFQKRVDFHHLAGGWARRPSTLPMPEPDRLNKNFEFSAVQNRILKSLNMMYEE